MFLVHYFLKFIHKQKLQMQANFLVEEEKTQTILQTKSSGPKG